MKANLNFKIHVSNWETNNYNAYIAQYLKKLGNRAKKFGQLIENNMNISLKSRTQSVVEKLFLGHFLKKQNWLYIWTNSLKVLQFVFIVCPSLQLSKYLETKVKTTCSSHLQQCFFKLKRGLELVSLPHFFHDFWRKLLLALTEQISLSECFYFLKRNCLFPGL